MLALERAKATTFDTSQLVNFTERSIYDQPVVQHTPLVKELGRLLITDQRLYFQVCPFANSALSFPVASLQAA